MKLRVFILVICCVIITVNSFSQPTVADQKTIGGDISDRFASMCLTKDGGQLLAGSSNSNKSGEKSRKPKGYNDFWIVKLTSNHKIQWDKTIGGNADEEATTVQQTSDGGYIIGGYSSSNISGDKTENSKGGFDYWIVKLDSSGNIQWNRTIGGNGDDFLSVVQQTGDKGYILGGNSRSAISGDKTESSRGNFDYWILKLDSTGNIQWNKTIGGSKVDELTSMQQTTDKGYIIGGYSDSKISGEKTEGSRGSYDYWVIKLDSTGIIEWDKTFGGNQGDRLISLQQTNDDGYILGGHSFSDRSGEKSEESRGGEDYWLIKIDASGNIQWNKTIGGNRNDYFNSLQQTSDEGYILGGSSISDLSGEKTDGSRGSNDYWVVKLNNNAKVSWDETIGGSSDDELLSIKEISKNHYTLGGYSNSGISGDKTDTSRGFEDYWIVYVNYTRPSLTTANSIMVEKQNLSNNFSVYPNPAKNILNVHTNIKATFTLTDQSGKTILAKVIDNSGTINVSNLAPGVYYVKNNATGSTQQVTIIR